MLAENLSQLVNCHEQAPVSKQRGINNTTNNNQQGMGVVRQTVSHQHGQLEEDSKNNQELVSWVKMDENALVKDFAANLSGLGLELGADAYNMSEVLNLPMFKQQESIISANNNQNLPPLQYMLCAPTSPASKVNEETLTYLNQGHPYEIKMKRLRDLPNFGHLKLAKSFLRVVFHDRRLQYTEHQQLEGWKYSRPGERVVNIDIPMSVGLMQPQQHPNLLNLVEFVWDLEKQSSVYIQVHCISTEFTPKKHGGERGVPFRIQIDTYHLESSGKLGQHIHSSSCQIKVFKPKGADRKQKTDKDKMERRSAQDKLKYQPSYDSTLLTECPPMPLNFYDEGLDISGVEQQKSYPESSLDSAVESDLNNTSPIVMDDTPVTVQRSVPGTQSNVSYGQLLEVAVPSLPPPAPVAPKIVDRLDSTATLFETVQWLRRHRFGNLVKTFNFFNGSDMLTLSRNDLIEICGVTEGIRLFNCLREKKVPPRLALYMTPAVGSVSENEGEMKVYRPFYFDKVTAQALLEKASSLFEQENGGGRPHIARALYQPENSSVHVLVTDELVGTWKNEQCFTVLVIKYGTDGLQIILKQE